MENKKLECRECEKEIEEPLLFPSQAYCEDCLRELLRLPAPGPEFDEYIDRLRAYADSVIDRMIRNKRMLKVKK